MILEQIYVEKNMNTDSYLQITFPGMSHWRVEEILDQCGTVIGYQVIRTQIAAATQPGFGNEHKLSEIRRNLENRANFLNKTAEPLQFPDNIKYR
jgi:hypothetical protein